MEESKKKVQHVTSCGLLFAKFNVKRQGIFNSQNFTVTAKLFIAVKVLMQNIIDFHTGYIFNREIWPDFNSKLIRIGSH